MNLLSEKMSIKDWIIDWISKNSNISNEILTTKLKENYLEIGWVDSFQFVSFLTDIEEEFKIKFSSEEFQNPNFSNIEGLVKLIEEKVK